MKRTMLPLSSTLFILALCFISTTILAQSERGFDKDLRFLELKSNLSSRPMLKACELKVIEDEFPRRVFTSAVGAPLKLKTQRFNLASFMTLISGLPPAPALREYAMIVHYGLDGSDELVFGIGFTTVSLLDFSYAMPTRFHMIDNAGDFDTGTATAAWLGMYGANYYAPASGTPKVYVNRTTAGTAPYPPYAAATDTKYMIMDLDRIMQFIANNSDATRPPAMNRIAISSYAHVLKPNLYHHGVALVPLNGNMSLADDLTYTGAGQFHRRALDLGSPCPENCEKVDFRYEGADITCPPEQKKKKGEEGKQ